MKTPLNLMNTQTIRGTSSSKSNYMFSSAERQLKGSSSRYRYESREDDEEEESSGFGGAVKADVQRVLMAVNPSDPTYHKPEIYPEVEIDISSDNRSQSSLSKLNDDDTIEIDQSHTLVTFPLNITNSKGVYSSAQRSEEVAEVSAVQSILFNNLNQTYLNAGSS